MGCLINHRYQGGSTYFNGSTSKVVISSSPANTFASNQHIALACWYNPALDVQTRTNDLIRNGTEAILRVENGNPVFILNSFTTNDRATSSMKLSGNRWYYLLGVYDGSTIMILVDNVVKGSVTPTGSYAAISAPWEIATGVTGSSYASGKIAEALIVKGDVSTAESSALYAAGTLPPTAVAFYPLDDLPSSYIDTIGGATGTGTATAYSPDVPVQMRTATDWEARSSLGFDGVDDQVEVENNSSLQFGANSFAYTIEIRPGSLTQSIDFIAKAGSAGNAYFIVRQRDGHRLFIQGNLDAGNTFGFIIERFFTNFEWKKITMVVDQDNHVVDVWHKGQKIATGAITGTPTFSSTANLFFGRGTVSGGYWNGLMKSVQIHSRAPTKAEIIDLHFNNIVPTTGLVLDLTMNEGAGATVYDQSGNGNDGTITGATWSAELPNAPRVPIGGNMVKNGDFSYVPVVNVAQTADGWLNGTASGAGTGNTPTPIGIYVNVNGSAQSEVIKGVGQNGGNAIKLSTTGVATSYVQAFLGSNYYYGRLGVNDAIPVKPSTSYRYSFKMKTQYVSGDSEGASLSITEATYTKTGITSTTVGKIKTTTDWTEYSGTIVTSPTTAFIVVLPQIYGHTGAGTLIMDAWFSDISLLPTTPVVNIPLSAPAVAITCP